MSDYDIGNGLVREQCAGMGGSFGLLAIGGPADGRGFFLDKGTETIVCRIRAAEERLDLAAQFRICASCVFEELKTSVRVAFLDPVEELLDSPPTLDTNGVGHGLARASDGELTTFDVPNSTNLSCFADSGFPFFPSPIMGINPAGTITGSYFEPISNPFGGNDRGFLRAPDGTFTTFDAVSSPSSPCCTWTFGIAINPAGEVAGWDNDYNGVNHGFVRAKDGTITILDAPGAGMALSFSGTQGTLARSINPAGQVTGFYYDPNGAFHGFLWKKK